MDNRKINQQLKGFDAVWHRVSSAKNTRRTAEDCGVKLMPKKNCNKRRGRYN